jgi:hypothetical protein
MKTGGQGLPELEKVAARPRAWEDVTLKFIPLQEGEEEGAAEVDDGPVEVPPIPDPLGLLNVDLRKFQEAAAAGMQRRALAARRSTMVMGLENEKARPKLARESTFGVPIIEDDDDEDEDLATFNFGFQEKRLVDAM